MYIINNRQQLEYTKSMTVVRKNMETFEVYYHEPSSGKLWKSFFPKGFNKHKGPKLLRPDPLPENIEQQLNICLNSDDDSDAAGLGIEWSAEPQEWSFILDLVDTNRKEYPRNNLNIFLEHLGVLDPQKNLDEIQTADQIEDIPSPDEFNFLRKKARKIKLKRFFRI
ncbi:hypothetical protein [Gracilimonas mengyeensis]|uniref:Uncharacterized protein n=1 Tax=Gracilimonas mengyeensis TaxID=1302730 RepID=A0A521DI77_9BACT|nr:hypothetical protein [Gracilimonas mengyeensis]SMO71282.1 hypothetical protein SAMN06265219_108188 [Gracilimonas mengyeensis]